jgi:hypothetical protein
MYLHIKISTETGEYERTFQKWPSVFLYAAGAPLATSLCEQ